MTEIDEILMEEVEEEKEVPEYEKFLNGEQVKALQKAGFVDKKSVRAASDEDLIKVEGIGAASVIKLREWGIIEVDKGDAVSNRFLVLKCDGETLDVRPGDIIPARFGAAEYVEKNQASWQ